MTRKKRLNPFKRRKVKVSVSNELVKRLIEKSAYPISKKDLGSIFDMILSNPDRIIANEVENYIKYKYDVDLITKHLKRSKKKVISFEKLRKKLGLSKRKFYPRLNIIKSFYSKSKNFKWSIQRGGFIRH